MYLGSALNGRSCLKRHDKLKHIGLHPSSIYQHIEVTKHKGRSTKHKRYKMNASIHHVNVTVPKSLEDAAKHFYAVVMGLEEVPKPESSRARGGAWYQLGPVQLHLSVEDLEGAPRSKRHVCYTVPDLD